MQNGKMTLGRSGKISVVKKSDFVKDNNLKVNHAEQYSFAWMRSYTRWHKQRREFWPVFQRGDSTVVLMQRLVDTKTIIYSDHYSIERFLISSS